MINTNAGTKAFFMHCNRSLSAEYIDVETKDVAGVPARWQGLRNYVAKCQLDVLQTSGIWRGKPNAPNLQPSKAPVTIPVGRSTSDLNCDDDTYRGAARAKQEMTEGEGLSQPWLS